VIDQAVGIELLDRDETHPTVRIGLEYAVNDADMKMGMQVEQGAETRNERYRAGACIWPCARAVRTQVALDLIEEDAQGAIEGFSLTLQMIAKPLGLRDYYYLQYVEYRKRLARRGREGCGTRLRSRTAD
jgi:hypothetical protein